MCVRQGQSRTARSAVWRIFARKTEFHKKEKEEAENEKFENLNAVEMGRLYRYGDGFKFQALGSGYVGGMTELFKNFGLDIDEGRD